MVREPRERSPELELYQLRVMLSHFSACKGYSVESRRFLGIDSDRSDSIRMHVKVVPHHRV
jgi:hypothetical protein